MFRWTLCQLSVRASDRERGWKRISWIAVAALPCLLASACAVMETDSDYDHAVDFSQLHTYAWIAELPLIRAQSRRVEISPAHRAGGLGKPSSVNWPAKGFKLVVAREEADFAIAFTVGARDTINIDDYPPYYAGIGIGKPHTLGRVSTSICTLKARWPSMSSITV